MVKVGEVIGHNTYYLLRSPPRQNKFQISKRPTARHMGRHMTGHRPPLIYIKGGVALYTAHAFTVLSPSLRVLTMTPKSQQSKARDGVLSTLNVAIETLNLAKEISSITPAKVAFGSVSALLTMIKVRFLNLCNGTPRVHVRPGFNSQ